MFLVEALPVGELCTLDGPEGHHAATVQRLMVGEALLLADGRGGTASAEVTAVGRGTLAVLITSRWYAEAPDPRLVVVQGIAKGDRGELAVQAMTEVGVDEIVPWAAARSVVRWRGERGAKARDKWAATAREAAKQARRPWLPVVGGDPDCSTKQVVARIGAAAAAFVLHEEATERLVLTDLPTPARPVTAGPAADRPGIGGAGIRGAGVGGPGVGGPGVEGWSEVGEIVLVVGPEGGITDDEVATFTAAGAKPVRLGDTVLRTSTAGVAALAVLSTRLHRW
jgi:16S rRNA (uracil1498-N3)-methyltransferase